MFFLILVGLILLLINPIVGGIYIAVILMAITIGLIMKEEKNKANKRIKITKRTKGVGMSNKLKELYETDSKKFWVYFSCAVIVVITVILCCVVIATADFSPCDHEYVITEEIAPTYDEKGKVVKECSLCGREKVETIPKLTPSETDTDWKTVFSSNGFTEDEISEYEEMLTNVGITDFHDVEVFENGIMHIAHGKIFDSKILQLNVTLENRKIILIELAGIPADKTEAYINWRGKLKFKTVQTKKSIDLYYDVDGGYIAKLDWDNKMISPYEE